ANAGPQFIFAHDVGAVANLPFLPQPYSFYSSAATTHNAGTDLCRFAGGAGDDFDIRANFNTDGSFYYGTDGASTGAQADFVATAMHEITHGLGFYAVLDTATGERDWFYGDAYINQVRRHQNGADAPRPLLELTEAERVEAVTSRFLLRFEGENARLANDGLGIRLYAPFPPRPGSSL